MKPLIISFIHRFHLFLRLFLNWTDIQTTTISLLFIHMPLGSFHSWFVGSYSYQLAAFITNKPKNVLTRIYIEYEPHMCNVGIIILLGMDLWMGMQVFDNSNVESMYMTNGTTQILLSCTSKDEKNLLSNNKMNRRNNAKLFLLKNCINEFVLSYNDKQSSDDIIHISNNDMVLFL